MSELKPQFGDLVENGWASEGNPQRRGYFVRSFTQSGKMNPGLTWEITDGRGKFWTFKPRDIGERLSVTSPKTIEGSGLVERRPLAFLKTWKADEEDRSRVDRTTYCEPWLEALNPEITPLFALSTPPMDREAVSQDSWRTEAAANDWITWKGGENPAPGKVVDVKYRNGDFDYSCASHFVDWGHPWNIGEPDPDYDIIAYRILPANLSNSGGED